MLDFAYFVLMIFPPRNVTGANTLAPQRPYDVSRGQNRYVTLPLEDPCLGKAAGRKLKFNDYKCCKLFNTYFPKFLIFCFSKHCIGNQAISS